MVQNALSPGAASLGRLRPACWSTRAATAKWCLGSRKVVQWPWFLPFVDSRTMCLRFTCFLWLFSFYWNDLEWFAPPSSYSSDFLLQEQWTLLLFQSLTNYKSMDQGILGSVEILLVDEVFVCPMLGSFDFSWDTFDTFVFKDHWNKRFRWIVFHQAVLTISHQIGITQWVPAPGCSCGCCCWDRLLPRFLCTTSKLIWRSCIVVYCGKICNPLAKQGMHLEWTAKKWLHRNGWACDPSPIGEPQPTTKAEKEFACHS